VKVDIRKSLSENEIAQINKSGAGLVLWFAPEVMAETDEAEEIFETIQQNLQNGQNLKEAVENALAERSDAYINHPMEVNKVCNGEKLTQSLGSNGIYKRFA
jgi:type II secretory pathway component PulF